MKSSLHNRILSDIENHILSGEWSPGHRIPFEHELTGQYGCSRMTVNKAITELVQRGLITRRRKSGSYVAQPHVQSAIVEIPDIPRDVRSRGLPYRYEQLKYLKRTASATDMKLLDLPSPAQLLEITILHWAGSQPFCLEERLINLSAVPEAADETFEQMPPGSWLISKVPWTSAQHRIRAISADRRLAELLQVPSGAACLSIDRRTLRKGVYVTHAHLTYRGDNHELFAEFEPAQARS